MGMTSPKPSRSSRTVRKITPSADDELRGPVCAGTPTIDICIPRGERATRGAVRFAWAEGVRIDGTSIWCDARRCPADATAFVSHARAPRLRGPGDCRVITTERTRLLRAIEVTPRGLKAGMLGPSGAAGGAERSGIIV